MALGSVARASVAYGLAGIVSGGAGGFIHGLGRGLATARGLRESAQMGLQNLKWGIMFGAGAGLAGPWLGYGARLGARALGGCGGCAMWGR